VAYHCDLMKERKKYEVEFVFTANVKEFSMEMAQQKARRRAHSIEKHPAHSWINIEEVNVTEKGE